MEKEILEELKTIKRLLATALTEGKKQNQAIEFLNKAGFGQKEIADTIGTTSNTVNVSLARIKKSKKNNAPKKAN
ncbi:hypothetical protein EHQ05_19295 [Leptospira yasudae]|uniref:hypothetical protein n=1 Tax=Leptospira yasudae TaxID=2202201 RepID=UPI00108372DD|nr:hypothetical protein [Leptospira yasudae]TGK23331.1 hypothetical protein EHQ05_19295 [Leptospira yasudae]TGM09808.1 hypothetical protein EHQ86_00115 [Leptospira yasudae]